MIDRWAGRDVDLRLLSESVKRFFDERLFPSRVEELSKEEFMITAILKRTSRASLAGNVRVAVRGKPDNFEVEFASGSDPRRLARLSGLATLLGGGALVLRNSKSSEELGKLENEFWLFIDKQVDILKRK